MINKRIIPLLLGLLPVLSGCATGYQNAANPLIGWMGGYWDQKGPGELIKVGFAGNGFIEREKVSVYLLYRCAEIAQREGKEFFVLYENLPAAIADRRSGEKSVGTITGKPTGYVYILLLDQPSGYVLQADDVIARLKPQVKPEVKS
jgi:hypothetical protein